MTDNNSEEEVSRTGAGLDLDDIQARCEAATPGGWEARHRDGERYGVYVAGTNRGITGWGCVTQSLEDAEFIAYARTDVPALLEEVRRLRASIEYFIQAKSEVIDQLGEAENEIQRLRAVLVVAKALQDALYGHGWFGPLWDELRAAIEAAQSGKGE